MKVHFSQWDEWWEEVGTFHETTDSVVRLTKVYEQRALGHFPLMVLWIVAGIVRGAHLIELEKRVGDYLANGDGQEVVNRADELVNQYAEEMGKEGFQVRAGRFVPDDYRSYKTNG